ncbi:TetR/AcrR family transcriptional regulator [Amycolatopsis pithecellobii]|uniref:TetR family transcriptional regulator n=1 Tax=Amycolatopsis pithecellobii TaxID=664692 RepID=A0A6N7Z208_9PSEU|nr:TetR/AcrR family transcriptional regulator [Amycolatopsis pithecellobii]MTD55573.1 TetR family transcriptional regulator [Amycolatopsis pithecellobii]
MAIEDRRQRERIARRRLITATARTLAENEGWDAVTTRRLSAEIEYSQPVLYKHFGSMEDIVEAVALEGMGELAETLRAARRSSATPDDEVGRVAAAFSDFAATNPALYDAMFTRPTRLPFGAEDIPAPLTDAFGELRGAVDTIAAARDVDTLTEVFWAALHGLVMLGRTERLRPEHHADRIEALVAQFRAGTGQCRDAPA